MVSYRSSFGIVSGIVEMGREEEGVGADSKITRKVKRHDASGEMSCYQGKNAGIDPPVVARP